MALHIYTRYVKILRLVLPALAIIGFLSLLIWPWWKERQQNILDLAAKVPVAAEQAPSATAPLQVMKPDYQGVDTKGRAYRITASRIEQNLNPKAPILLIEPMATLTLEPGTDTHPARTISLQGLHGLYDAQAQTLDLKGQVVLHYMDIYDITTEDLAVDLGQGAAMTTTPVQGRGPQGFLSGQSLNIADKGRIIVLKGPGKLVLQPRTAAQPASDPMFLSVSTTPSN